MRQIIPLFSLRPLAGALLLSSLLLFSAIACQKESASSGAGDSEEPLGSITLTVECDEPAIESRAVSAYTTVEDYEAVVKKAEFFVFDATSGVMNSYLSLTNPTVTAGQLAAQTLTCTQGSKHIYAVLNGGSISGLSAVRTEAAFQSKVSDLSHNGRSTDTGFTMIGRLDKTVNGDNQAASITVKRLAFRVVLQKITNSSSLGALEVKSVFLINSAKQLSLQMTNESTLPITSTVGYNIAGKKTGSSSFVAASSSTSDVPDMLFQDHVTSIAQGSSSSTRKMVYGYPHTSTGTNTPRLVVLASLAGNDYYYPMNIPSPLANDTFTIELTIKNIGSSDPNLPVETGSASVTVTVGGWTSKTGIDTTI